MLLDGRDVSARIRERDVTEAASKVSVHPQVRPGWWLGSARWARAAVWSWKAVTLEQKFFPMLTSRFFSMPIRWCASNGASISNDQGSGRESMAADLRERDRRDRTRAASPLVAAGDAVVINSSALSEDEVLAQVEGLVSEKRGE